MTWYGTAIIIISILAAIIIAAGWISTRHTPKIRRRPLLNLHKVLSSKMNRFTKVQTDDRDRKKYRKMKPIEPEWEKMQEVEERSSRLESRMENMVELAHAAKGAKERKMAMFTHKFIRKQGVNKDATSEGRTF